MVVNAQHTHTQGMRGGVGVGVGGGGVRSSRLPSFHPYGVNRMLGTIGVGLGGLGGGVWISGGGGFKRGLGGSKGDTEGPVSPFQTTVWRDRGGEGQGGGGGRGGKRVVEQRRGRGGRRGGEEVSRPTSTDVQQARHASECKPPCFT